MKKAGTDGRNDRVGQTIAFLFLLCFSIVFLIPLVYAFVSAFKVDLEVNRAGGFLFLPQTWTLENFQTILNPHNKQLPVYYWFINSFVVSGSHTLLAVTIHAMSAYAYAKMNFRGRNFIFLSMLFLSSFPAIVNFVPLYKIMLTLGWLNSPLALIFPGLAGMFNIFLIRQFLYGIPSSLLESARLDGAGEFTIFARLVVPLSRPILIIVGLFCFTANWNDFLWPSIAINNIDKLTLTAGLQLAKGVYNQVGKISAIAVVATAPMILLFLLMQKHFINGVSLSSGVKG